MAVMSTDGSKVRISGYVPVELRDAWVQKFGDYGSYSWLFTTVLDEMLTLCASRPDAEATIRRAVQEHISTLANERAQR